MPYWDDLNGFGHIAYYQTTGTAPNRVFTFEWNGWGVYAGTGTGNFQVKLYEGTNVIDFCYGASTYSGNSATIGIANSTTDYKTLNNSSAAPVASGATFTTSVASTPANGQVYRWTPCTVTVTAANDGPTCPGGTIHFTGTSSGTSYTWTGPGGFASSVLSPTLSGINAGGTYVLTASNGSCSVSASTIVALNPAPPVPVVTPSVATICNGGTVTLTATVPSGTINLIPNESWENGVPTVPATPVDGWRTTATSTGYLTQVTTGTFPSAGPQSGTYFAAFHSFSYSGITVALISPSFSMASVTGGQVTFWVYRDCASYNTAGYNGEGITIYANTSPTVAGGTSLGYVPRRGGFTTSGGVTGTSTTTTSGWYQFTCTIPATFTGGTNYILFNFVSQYGDDIYLDNISMTGNITIPAPTWSPTTNLYTNPGLTTPYASGTTAYTVYVHPTTIVSTTTTSYIATTTNGTCTSADTSIITVNPGLPAITGPSAVCIGSSITLSNTSSGGAWSSSNTSVATIDPLSGLLSGLTAGQDTVYYTVTGCTSFAVITVNNGTPVTGATFALCTGGSSVTLNNATLGGTWSTSAAGIATVSPSGMVTSGTAGIAIITYTSPSGCADTALITVLAPPPAITGNTSVCYAGGTTILSDSTGGGTWSTSNASVATINSSGLVTGLSAGNANITYALLPGCFTATPLVLNPFPAPITGAPSVCAGGSVITLHDATAPGSWGSNNPAIASVDPSGAVTGIVAGTAVISYTLPTGCASAYTIVVNPLPSAITGAFAACQGSVTVLADTSVSGSWTSGNTAVATVDAAGNVSGVSVGTAVITYTLPTSCLTTASVSITPIPGPIAGSPNICFGSTTSLGNSVAGGTWSSSSVAVATVDSMGVVYGAATGTATITYTSGGCYTTRGVTVSPLVPAGISISATPSGSVCAGTAVSFTPTLTNGGTAPIYVWSVNNVILSGASSYNYTPANGDLVRCWFISSYACAVPDTASASVAMIVNPIVTPALSLTTGMGDTVCNGLVTTISALPSGGGPSPVYQWFVNLVATGTTGSTYSYTPSNGDIITANMTSNAPCRTANTATSTKILTVSPFVTPGVAVSPDPGSTDCEGYPVQFTAFSVNGGTAPHYQWSVNGVNTGVGTFYSYVPANHDSVNVMMTSNFPCVTSATANDAVTMTIIPVIAPVGGISVSPGYIVTSGTPVTFTASIVSGGGSAPTYQWVVNSAPVPGATNNVYINASLDNGDSVSCVIVNTDQCSGIATFASVHITIAGNTGIAQVGNTANITLAPNPNNGSFTIKGEIGGSENSVLIEVTDMTGKVVYTNTAQIVNGQIDEPIRLSGLANGMYLLNVKGGGTNGVFHFVIEQ